MRHNNQFFTTITARTAMAMIAMCLLLCACTQRDNKQNAEAWLTSIGVNPAHFDGKQELNFDDNGANLKMQDLDSAQIHALQLDSLLGVDPNYATARLWGIRPIEGTDMVLLLGQTEFSDTRPCFMMTLDAEGNPVDMMKLGECGGLNLTYWDQVDEQTLRKGVDSMLMTLDEGNSIMLNKWVTMYETPDEDKTKKDLWNIRHQIPVNIDQQGHFNLGNITSSHSNDTTLLTPYWLDKRELEIFSLTPMSDNTMAQRLNEFLDKAKSDPTDPKELLGDFSTVVFERFRGAPDTFMQWIADNPDTQLARATVMIMKDQMRPEQLRYDLGKLKSPDVRESLINVMCSE